MENRKKEFFKYLGISILLYLLVIPCMVEVNDRAFSSGFRGEIQSNTIGTIIFLFTNIMNLYLIKRIKTKQGKKLAIIAMGLSLLVIIIVGTYLCFEGDGSRFNAYFYIELIFLLNMLIGSIIWYKTGNKE